MSEIKSAFVVDNKTFDTKAEANAYLRRPAILNALNEVTESDEELSEWLLENRDTVESAFEVGTVRRVKQAERNKISRGLEVVAEAVKEGTINNTQDMQFLVENADQLVDTFRWPKVKRLTEEEKALQAKNTLMKATENNEDLAVWITQNQESITGAYSAGKPKREVSPKAIKALEEYRAKQAAAKAKEAEAEE